MAPADPTLAGSALLVMDLMQGIAARYAEAGAGELLEALGGAIAAARHAGIPVIFVRIAFREGYPEVSSRNRFFGTLQQRGGFSEADEATAIVAALGPEPGDITVLKRRVSAFTGSDLDVVLRAQGITTLVLTGISTSGVVLSTLREAADRDYGLIVLADGCLDADPEVHRVLMEKVFPRQAEVTTVDDWCARLLQ
ncbi:MAG TPA: isochorismatase family cysteine hydrolase [Actinomycetota bacterium]|nr:isochorismatase family cysteine hydrolase [Actinomycetota bacterium]